MKFERITPEAAGVPSEAVERFARRLATRDVCLHSFIMLKGGKLFADCYVKPFEPGDKHRMYSTSKTFVSMAIGMLIGEGKISLEDKIAGYFPEKLPEKPHRYLLETTVEDLLTMATPFDSNTYDDHDKDWVATFFRAEPTHPSGTLFAYNTAATVVLCALVEKLSGKPLLEYMRPALDEIGFSRDAWCVERPEGGAWGGSGVVCTPEDLASFAMLLLRGGKWNGKQLIPEWYVRQATSRRIDNSLDNATSEESQGYGYQVWMTRHGGFATIGMGAQIALCLPEYDAVLVTTGDTQASSVGVYEVFSAFWSEIYPYLRSGPIPENRFASASCSAYLSWLSLSLPYIGRRSADSELEIGASETVREVSGKTYLLDKNPMRLEEISLTFAGDVCFMRYKNATGEHELELGIGRFRLGEFPETRYYGVRIGESAGRGYRCASSIVWSDPKTLIGRIYIIDDYFGTLRLEIAFKGRDIAVRMRKNAEWFLDEYQGVAGGTMSAESGEAEKEGSEASGEQ